MYIVYTFNFSTLKILSTTVITYSRITLKVMKTIEGNNFSMILAILHTFHSGFIKM